MIDNVYHSPNDGDIHFNVYVPESYDGGKPYALFFTLPGYEGLYFQGVARNLEAEAFGFEAQKYNPEMIIVAPQLSDWRETSASQTIALLEYFLEEYNIDRERVYANGYSGGGETNQSFAAAGLIDELSLVISPTADGDSGSASLFETGGFSAPSPKAYRLKAVEQIEKDTLWIRYIKK